jgi:UDP-N-acetyl-D-glucosamine dehydrogenase
MKRASRAGSRTKSPARKPEVSRTKDWIRSLHDGIEEKSARVGVIGLGYVGLPLALEFAKVGFEVVGFDLDESKVKSIRAGRSYNLDIADDELAAVVRRGALKATTDFDELKRMDAINICVPTPLKKTKDPDVSYILAAVEEIKKRLRPGQLVILGSTTYPGTTYELFLPMLEETGLKVGSEFFLSFAPERIDPGNKQFPIWKVAKVVGGITPNCTRLAQLLFEKIVKDVIPVSSTQSAEMVKLLENTFRAVNIGLANEVAIMCNKLGIDVWEVIDAAASKPYGFMKFQPGPGLGGHCIPIDPAYLAWKLKALNYRARFIELATEVNSEMPNHVIMKITDALNAHKKSVNGSKILVLGVAYKKDVSDVRESPALDIIEMLEGKGAEVKYHDPYVPILQHDSRRMRSTPLTSETARSVDCVAIITDHSNIDYRWVVDHARCVVDTRNATKGITAAAGRVVKL